MMDSDEHLDELFEVVLQGRMKQAGERARLALAEGVTAEEILHDACIPAMDEVGIQFERGDKFVPEMLVSAKTMQEVMKVLKPLLVSEGSVSAGTMVIGTVSGDVHDIGKNLVGMMMEGAGFTVVDLGVDVDPEAFVDAVREHQPELLGLSALLSTTMPALAKTILTLKSAGVRDQVKVMVGGAPVSEEFARRIGADGYAPDAGSAPRVAKALLGIE
jgi:methanogenic corrinoid protein MtbC1